MPDTALRPGVVAIYAIVALLALNAARRGRGRERTAWLLTAAILVLLGTAKLFQVQETVTDAARNGLASMGWYADHREVQAAAAVVVLVVVIAGLAFTLWRWLRVAAPSLVLDCAALALLIAFIAIRAASIHAIDFWVTTPLAGMRRGWWVELVGLLAIASAALAYAARRSEAPGEGR